MGTAFIAKPSVSTAEPASPPAIPSTDSFETEVAADQALTTYSLALALEGLVEPVEAPEFLQPGVVKPVFGSDGMLQRLPLAAWMLPSTKTDFVEAAWAHVATIEPSLGLGLNCALVVADVHLPPEPEEEETTIGSVVFLQYHQGIPVDDAKLTLILDIENNLRGVESNLVAHVGLTVESLSAQEIAVAEQGWTEAEHAALQWLNAGDHLRLTKAVHHTVGSSSADVFGYGTTTVFDAQTGEWISETPVGMHAAASYVIDDAADALGVVTPCALPRDVVADPMGTIVCPRRVRFDSAATCCGDFGTDCGCPGGAGTLGSCNTSCPSASTLGFADAVEAQENWDSFFDGYGWNSWDDGGLQLRAFLNYQPVGVPPGFDYCGSWMDNTIPGLWMGAAPLFDDGTAVIGSVGIDDHELHYHEYTHGCLSAAAGINSVSAGIPQVTVITEHLCDTMSLFISNPLTPGDWLWPEDSDTHVACGRRDFAYPHKSLGAGSTTLKQPSEWANFKVDPTNPTFAAWAAYQHINNGILNHLIYLLNEGETFNGITVPVVSRPMLARLLFVLGTDYLTTATNLDGYRDAFKSAALFQDFSSGNFTLPLTTAVLAAANAVGLWEPHGLIFPGFWRSDVSPAAVVLQGGTGSDELYLFTRDWDIGYKNLGALNVTRANGDPSLVTNWSLPTQTQLYIRDSPAVVQDTASVARLAITQRPFGFSNPFQVSVLNYDAVATGPGWPGTIVLTDVPNTSGTGAALSDHGPAITKFAGVVYVFYVHGGQLYMWREGQPTSELMLDSNSNAIADVRGQPSAVVDGGRLWVHFPRDGVLNAGVWTGADITYTSSLAPNAPGTWAVPALLETDCGDDDIATTVDVGIDSGATIMTGVRGGHTYLVYSSGAQVLDPAGDPHDGCGENEPCAPAISRGMIHVRLTTSGVASDTDYFRESCAVPQNLATTGEFGDVSSVGAIIEFFGKQWAFYAEGQNIGRKSREGF